MAKNRKLKKLELLRDIVKMKNARQRLQEHYRVLLAKNAVIKKDIAELSAEIEALRQYMPNEIPEDIENWVKEQQASPSGEN